MVRVGCLECGRPPPQDLMSNSKGIQAMVGDSNEHRRVLFNAGLVEDHHLSMFLEWAPCDQKAFIDALDTSAFTKGVLTHNLIPLEVRSTLASSVVLGNQGNDCDLAGVEGGRKDVGQGPQAACTPELSSPPPPYGRAFRGVQQPCPEIEEALTDPNEPDDMLFRALCLEGSNSRKLFDELVVCGTVSYDFHAYPNIVRCRV